MDIFGVLQMLGGLCLFLFGMETMGDGLTKASGNKMEKILEKLSPEELDSIKGGTWVLTDKGWVWIEGAI